MLPGGRVEEWEGFGDVLQREVFEETAYEIDQKDLRYRWTFVTTIKLTNQQDSTQDYWLVLSYYEYSMNKDNDPILSDEHQQRRRVTLDVIQESLQGIVADTEYISFL
jgi:ADP-ribose pyrophosphatase YjhB (NUDIX family)